MHLVVIAFSLLHEDENPNSPNGNHTIALLQTTENYDDMSAALVNIIEDIKTMQSITIDDISISIEFFLGADWKFLALFTGIESASSTYFCIWCKCAAEFRHIVERWSMEDPEKGAQTIAEIQKFAETKKKATEKYGCVRQPLFPSIPVDHIIPDVLHLFLRISDVLINLFITELRRLNGLEKVRIQKIDQSKVNIKKYEKFINETYKVGFHFFVDKDSKQLQWRDLTGPEKLKLFTLINIPELFPNVPNCHVVQKIHGNI